MKWRWKQIASALTAAGVVLGIQTAATAKPEYARKEGQACLYCHQASNPGSIIDPATGQRQGTARNERGTYYGAHNHSFVGYISKSGWPSFRYMWKEEFKTLPRRIAVADVTGDGKSRLITLNEKPDDKNSSTLEVKRWTGTAFVTEFTGPVSAPPDRLAVGKIGGTDRPAVILTSDALWTWNGSTFVRQAAPTPLPIIGVTRLTDGTERVLLAPTSKSVLAYRVNLTAVRKDDWLLDPIPAPTPPKYLWGDVHAAPEFLQSMGYPSSIGSGGMLGMWYQQAYKSYFLYQMDRGTDLAADPNNPGVPKVVFNSEYHVTVRETAAGGTVWTSPRLPGNGLDIVIEDPKGGGKQGLLMLFNGTTPVGGVPGKGRTLAFFAME